MLFFLSYRHRLVERHCTRLCAWLLCAQCWVASATALFIAWPVLPWCIEKRLANLPLPVLFERVSSRTRGATPFQSRYSLVCYWGVLLNFGPYLLMVRKNELEFLFLRRSRPSQPVSYFDFTAHSSNDVIIAMLYRKTLLATSPQICYVYEHIQPGPKQPTWRFGRHFSYSSEASF